MLDACVTTLPRLLVLASSAAREQGSGRTRTERLHLTVDPPVRR